MTQRPAQSDLIRELVFEYLERVESEGPAALEEICERVPEHAAKVRARVAVLYGTGLSDPSPTARGMPERLGPFRLGEPIGGGGMGIVYEAHDEALGRDVAVKVVRPSELMFRGARERFQREIEAVASLSHPGIVPVFSAGDDGGMPYFAMERVEGCTLAEALALLVEDGHSPPELTGGDLARAVERATDAEKGSTRGVELFDGTWTATCARVVREIALALDHAHERGILHRDVKPSNVMVTPAGRVMLLDFGLSSSDDVERITRTGSALGSLPYMSPEQVDGDWDGLDRRADVYSLGVTLYELLTLQLPYRAPSIAGLRNLIVEGRHAPVRRVNPRVTWELETVVEVAMEPDSRARYASCGALAGDLAAALDGRPIEARRAGALRRTRRWVARRPAAAGLVALSAAVVVGGPIVFGLQERDARLAAERQGRIIAGQRSDLAKKNEELEQTLIALGEALADAREQRDEAEAQEGRAERNFQRALAAVGEFLTRVGDETLRDVPALQALRSALLEDALAFYQELLEDQRDDPRLRFETARAWARVGDLQGLLDRVADAETSYREARAVLEVLHAETPKSAAIASELASVRGQLAQCDRMQGRVGEALDELAQTLTWAETVEVTNDDENAERLARVRHTLVLDMADAQRDAGQLGKVIETLEPLFPELEAACAGDATDREAVLQLTRGALLLGMAYTLHPPATPAAVASAVRVLERSNAVAAAALERTPSDARLRHRLSRGLTNLGGALGGAGDYPRSRSLLERAAVATAELREDYPGVVAYEIDHGTAHVALGATMAVTGEVAAGLETMHIGQATLEALLESPSSERDAVEILARSQLQEAIIQWALRREAEAALDHVGYAIELYARALELRPGAAAPKAGLAQCHEHGTWIRHQSGDHAGAAEAALVWTEHVVEPRNCVAIAMILAKSADEAERAGGSEDDVALFDDVAAEMLQRAIDGGMRVEELRSDSDLAGLRARPNASAPLGR